MEFTKILQERSAKKKTFLVSRANMIIRVLCVGEFGNFLACRRTDAPPPPKKRMRKEGGEEGEGVKLWFAVEAPKQRGESIRTLLFRKIGEEEEYEMRKRYSSIREKKWDCVLIRAGSRNFRLTPPPVVEFLAAKIPRCRNMSVS